MDVLVIRGKGSRSEEALKALRNYYQNSLGREVLHVRVRVKDDNKNRAVLRTRSGSKLSSIEQMRAYLGSFTERAAASRARPPPSRPPPVESDFFESMASVARNLEAEDDDDEEKLSKAEVAHREKAFDARFAPKGGRSDKAPPESAGRAAPASEDGEDDFAGDFGEEYSGGYNDESLDDYMYSVATSKD